MRKRTVLLSIAVTGVALLTIDYPSGWRVTMASDLLTTSLFRFHEPVIIISECDPCRKSSGIVKTGK
jgi:uncharacterized membrane protein